MLMILSAISLSAQAFQSDPQTVVYDDTAVLFQDIAIDSGWLPNSGPISLRFEFLTNGGAELSGEGEAQIHWDDNGSELSFAPRPDSGLFAMTTVLEFLVSLRFDINFWSWEGALISETIEFEAEEEHSPFLFEDQEPNRLVLNADAAGFSIYDFGLEVIPGIADVAFYLELEPQLEIGAEGIGWYLDGQLAEQSTAGLAVDLEGQSMDFAPSYVAAFDGQLDMSINPIVEVCVLVLCTDWTPVEVPFEVVSDQQEHIFPPSEITFPLPSIRLEDSAVDFGTVDVGETHVFELPIYNDGLWYLEGSTLLFGGDGAVSVYPDLLMSAPESSDGLLVQLSPTSAGPIEAVLQLHSNDPQVPILEIRVTANAIDVEESDTTEDAEEEIDSAKVSAPVGGCGCATTSSTSPMHWILGFLPLAVFRLRRHS